MRHTGWHHLSDAILCHANSTTIGFNAVLFFSRSVASNRDSAKLSPQSTALSKSQIGQVLIIFDKQDTGSILSYLSERFSLVQLNIEGQRSVLQQLQNATKK